LIQKETKKSKKVIDSHTSGPYLRYLFWLTHRTERTLCPDIIMIIAQMKAANLNMVVSVRRKEASLGRLCVFGGRKTFGRGARGNVFLAGIQSKPLDFCFFLYQDKKKNNIYRKSTAETRLTYPDKQFPFIRLLIVFLQKSITYGK
jgi:hypothetical protein